MNSRPLEGLKVVDMAWLMVGPESARYLADLGADVIKLESQLRPDPLRSLASFKDGIGGPNRSLSYHSINAGKRSIALDLKQARGYEAALRLFRWADVVIEAFTPGVADKLKLSYPHLSKENPSLIMVSTSILGAKGPASYGLSGTGVTGSAFSGATNMVGWPDRLPSGPSGPWTDAVAPRFIVASILAALHRRDKTQQGCFIDASQAESGMQFLTPAYFDFAINGVSPQRRGSAGSPIRIPSGVYPCQGTDQWIAIEASDDETWQVLYELLETELRELSLNTIIKRMRYQGEVDAAISRFTSSHDASLLEAKLQRLGIPCHKVSRTEDLANDEDLTAEGYYRTVSVPEVGEVVIRGPQSTLQRTPHAASRPAPQIGDCSQEILRTVCGFSQEEVEMLKEDGILQ